MPKLTWDEATKKYYETGVSHGILFPTLKGVKGVVYGRGVAWNGLSKISETSSGGDENAIYADNGKYVAMTGTEEFEFTIEAYQAPKEFDECVGVNSFNGMNFGQQKRRRFGLSYTTLTGNDTDGLEHGEKIHLVYGALANSSDKDYETVNDSPDAMTMSWECNTLPVAVTGFKPISHLVLDSRKLDNRVFALLKDRIYGSVTNSSGLPLPEEIKGLLNSGLVSVKLIPVNNPNDDGTLTLNDPSRTYVIRHGQDDIAISDAGVITGYVGRGVKRTGSNGYTDEVCLVMGLDWTTIDDGMMPMPSVTVSGEHWVETSTGRIGYSDLNSVMMQDYWNQSGEISIDSDSVAEYEHHVTLVIPLTTFFNYFSETDPNRSDALALSDVKLRISFSNFSGAEFYSQVYSLAGLSLAQMSYIDLPTEEPEEP